MESSVFLATVRFRRAEARTVICTVQLRAVLSCPGPPCSKGPPRWIHLTRERWKQSKPSNPTLIKASGWRFRKEEGGTRAKKKKSATRGSWLDACASQIVIIKVNNLTNLAYHFIIPKKTIGTTPRYPFPYLARQNKNGLVTH